MNINNYKFADATGNPLNTGGLVGSFTGNTLSYGYFAGSILDKCNYTTLTDCKIGNVIGDDAGTTVSNIFTSHPLINKGGRNETPINYSTDLRAQTSFSTTLNSFNSDTGSGCNIDPCWYHTDKDLPRLAFETHDCSDNLNLLDIFSQAGTQGRGGSESNPIIICTQDQLRAIGNTAQSLSWHYMLKDHLLVGDFTSDRIGTDTNTQFIGSFNGNEKILYGLKLNITSGTLVSKGMFNYVGSGGSVKNVRLHGIDIYDETTKPLGALVGENSGLISNSFIRRGNIVAGTQSGATGSGTRVGGLVGKNNGVIELSGGGVEMQARNIVGGIVGENTATGIIRDAVAHGYIQPRWNLYGLFGGGIGMNYGTVERLTVHTKLDMQTYSPSSSSTIGGIVGQNMSSGIIRDAYAENNQINMTYPSSNDINSSQSIGPVYGENAGTLKRIVSNTEVRIDSMTYGTCLAPAPDDPTCTGTYGGFWTGAECLVSATDESSCTAASSIWYPTNLFHAVASIRGTTDTTNGIYHTIDPYLSLLETTTSACAVNGSFLELTVTNASAYDLSLTTKHVILGNFEAKGTLSAQIAGPKLKVLASQFGGDCTQINNMITNNGGSLSTKVVEIFNQDINSAKPMSYMTEFNNFCSSATGVPDDPNFVCSNAGDWDIVTDIDHTRNMGFDRLLNKYLSIMANNTSALSQGPFWQMEANKPPRLINFD